MLSGTDQCGYSVGASLHLYETGLDRFAAQPSVFLTLIRSGSLGAESSIRTLLIERRPGEVVGGLQRRSTSNTNLVTPEFVPGDIPTHI